VSGLRAFLDRPPESYGRVEWLVRTGVRNAQWLRAEGVRRLVEEHELHPARRALTATRKARWRRSHSVAAGTATAVFVTGVPRSGTNMIVRGLATLPAVEVHNEGDRAAFHRYRLRPDPVIRDVVRRSEHRLVLLKPLLDMHRVPGLLDDLGAGSPPRAVWAHRDVDGRVRSAISKFGPAAKDALAAIASGRATDSWQALGLSAASMDIIRSISWQQASAADGAALLWYVKNQLFFELGMDSRADVVPISYETLTREPDRTMRVLCDFAGVAWQPSVSRHIDRRAERAAGPVLLDPRIRSLCTELAERLAAAEAASWS
jgi:hypothetical protein